MKSILHAQRGASLFVRGARTYPPGPDASSIDVRIVDGVIDAVGRDLERASLPVLDAQGLTLIQGLVDVHVHFRDPGLEHKEGWDHGSAGALHGGVTSVVEVQNNPPLSTSLEALQARIEHVRSRSRVDFGCLANLLPDAVPELAAMAPYTPAFKCFLGGSTGLGGETDYAVLEKLFAAAARAGRMIVAHAEDENLLRLGKKQYPNATANEHHLVRSAEAEIESVRMSIGWVERTGAELHVFHVSTRGACELIADARRRGLPVSGSTGPQYIHLSNEDAPRLGNLMKINPSIKTRDDNRGILEALRSGAVDAIGTDHAPHPLDEKRREYAHASSGMPSVDLLWPLTWELVVRGELDPWTALASVSWRAAQSLHLPGKGRLLPGFDGDLALFDPTDRRRVEGRLLPSRSKWSAFEGVELGGFPVHVVRRGTVAFTDGSVTGAAGGRPLELEPPRPRA
ncbi:MAG: dihydroorotase family protein [Planctomycetota bacterium]|nr:dihydroorotase family protein [Planctomycetota bacterium]